MGAGMLLVNVAGGGILLVTLISLLGWAICTQSPSDGQPVTAVHAVVRARPVDSHTRRARRGRAHLPRRGHPTARHRCAARRRPCGP
jgi:hypothetical protein